jgi:hypothetical protein
LGKEIEEVEKERSTLLKAIVLGYIIWVLCIFAVALIPFANFEDEILVDLVLFLICIFGSMANYRFHIIDALRGESSPRYYSREKPLYYKTVFNRQLLTIPKKEPPDRSRSFSEDEDDSSD